MSRKLQDVTGVLSSHLVHLWPEIIISQVTGQGASEDERSHWIYSVEIVAQDTSYATAQCVSISTEDLQIQK